MILNFITLKTTSQFYANGYRASVNLKYHSLPLIKWVLQVKIKKLLDLKMMKCIKQNNLLLFFDSFKGLVYREDKNQILVIKDRIMVKDFWKLPGGAGTQKKIIKIKI